MLDTTQKDGDARPERRDPPSPPPPAKPRESRMNRVARRAHQIYEARGGQDGRALEDWLQAEREIDAEIDAEGAGG